MKTRSPLKAAALGIAAALLIPASALASFAPAPPGTDPDPRCEALAFTLVEDGRKALFFDSAWNGTTSSMNNGTNVCNHTKGKSLIYSMVGSVAGDRSTGAPITITVVGNTDRDAQTTNNLPLSWLRATSGRWYVEQAMRSKFGSLPVPVSSLNGQYRKFFYDYDTGGDVTVLVYGASDINASGRTTEAKRADRNATVKVAFKPVVEDPTPVAVDDAFSFSYADTYTGNVAANDTCNSDTCSFRLTAPPSQGSALMNPSTGSISFSLPQYFIGSLTAEYAITGSNGATSKANILVSVSEPGAAAVPDFSHTAELTAPTWARLSTTEYFTASVSMNCASGVQTSDRCTRDNGINGSFVKVVSMLAASNTLKAPLGYPTSRYAFNGIPEGSRFPATGTMRFTQATSAGNPFEVRVVVETRFQEGTFSRSNGTYQETLDRNVQVRFQNMSASVGVVGVTR